MTDTVIDTKPKVIEVSEIPYCSFCSEKASGQTLGGIDLCNIPGNHPGYDGEEIIPYQLKVSK